MNPTRTLETDIIRYLWRHLIILTAGAVAAELAGKPREGFSRYLEPLEDVQVHECGHSVAALLCGFRSKRINVVRHPGGISGIASLTNGPVATAEIIDGVPSDGQQAANILAELQRRIPDTNKSILIDKAIKVTRRLLFKHWPRVGCLWCELRRQNNVLGEEAILRATGLPRPSFDLELAAAFSKSLREGE